MMDYYTTVTVAVFIQDGGLLTSVLQVLIWGTTNTSTLLLIYFDILG